jgi:CRP/FNR family transcriptional regulator, cyclic AMP receptor protein
MTNVGVSQDLDIMAQISIEDREELLRHSLTRAFPKGALINSPGQHIDFVHYVLSGRVKVFDLSACGREIIFRICGPKSFFGIAEIFTNHERLVFAEALDPVEAVCIDKLSLERVVQRNAAAALLVIRILGNRIRQNHIAIKGFVFGDARYRTAHLLVKFAEIDGHANLDGSVTLGSRFTHQVIADMTGTSRQTVTEIVNDFKRQGYVSSAQKRITILDLAGLKSLTVG